MEIRLLDKEELWSVLSTDDLYHTHVVLSAQKITSPLPSVDVKTLPLSWIFDPSKADMLDGVSYTRDQGWYCTVVHGTLTLALNTKLYSECGLQCKKTRSQTRDVYVFSCDVREPSRHNRTRLSYCFANVLNEEYRWFTSTLSKPCSHRHTETPDNEDIDIVPDEVCPQRMRLPLSIDSPHDLQELVDTVGARLLDICPGSLDSPVNTLCFSPEGEECWAYTSSCCLTGRDFCRVLAGLRDQVRFISLHSWPTLSWSSQHVTCYFTGDQAYLLQYEAR